MKIVLVLNDTFSAWIFRKGLIKALVEKSGNQVFIVAPEDKTYSPLLKTLGAIHVPIPMKRFTAPLHDFLTCIRLYRFFRKHQPDVVHNFTIKPNIYGTLTARLAGIRTVFCSVTGLGYLYSEDANLFFRTIRFLATFLYRIACRLCTKFSFQNADDMNFFIRCSVLPREKAVLIRSSGIDLAEFNKHLANPEKVQKELLLDQNSKVVLMLTRALVSKGVNEYIQASRIVRKEAPSIKFFLVGGVENGPDALSQAYLESVTSDNFRWLGFRDNVRDYLAAADVVVLPSYYQEGIPRCLLEAMAMEKPIITTDHVGCKEVVEDSKNGYLIPIKDPRALAKAITQILVKDGDKIIQFGNYSRAKVEKEFGEGMVIEKTLTELYGLKPSVISTCLSNPISGQSNSQLALTSGRV